MDPIAVNVIDELCGLRVAFEFPRNCGNGVGGERLLVEQASKVVGAEVGIAPDAGEGAATEFAVQRDDECVFAPGLLQANVAAALTDNLPALLAKRLDQALTGDDRLTRTHAGRGIERRITPLSSGSPSSRRPST